MKASNRIFIAVAFSLASIFAYSQNQPDNRIAQGWPISKDVQKFSNKNWMKSETGLTIESVGQPEMVISKRVQTVGRPVSAWSSQKKANVVSKGYPSWIISKGVQRLNR
jgi:hypothetical protein